MVNKIMQNKRSGQNVWILMFTAWQLIYSRSLYLQDWFFLETGSEYFQI